MAVTACLAVDYRYVNRFTRNDAFPLPDVKCIPTNWKESVYAECKVDFWQLGVKEEDKWLTAFVFDAGFFLI